MTDKTKDITVDLGVFPLPIVESALYALGDHVAGRIGEVANNRVSITVEALEDDLDAAAMERAFNRALIVTSVSQRAFQSAASIRNYLAQTALSVTTESQQTIKEFASSLGSGGIDAHDGAPAGHLDVSLPGDQADPSATGVQLTVDEENGHVLLRLDGRKYLLPDVLWAAHQMRDTCACSIDNTQPGGQLLVLLEPDGEIDLHTSGERFKHWLDVAAERSL